MSALQSFGRPNKLELMVLVDRRFSRELPIQADYTGVSIDAMEGETVKLDWESKTPKVYILQN